LFISGGQTDVPLLPRPALPQFNDDHIVTSRCPAHTGRSRPDRPQTARQPTVSRGARPIPDVGCRVLLAAKRTFFSVDARRGGKLVFNLPVETDTAERAKANPLRQTKVAALRKESQRSKRIPALRAADTVVQIENASTEAHEPYDDQNQRPMHLRCKRSACSKQNEAADHECVDRYEATVQVISNIHGAQL